MKIKTALLAALIASNASLVFADERIGRYTSATPGPAPYQTNLLSSVIHLTLPREINRIGDAYTVLLSESGYRLSSEQDPNIHQLFNQPVPAVHRQIGPMQLIQALEVLAGEQWMININPVLRTISFELRDEYRHFLDGVESTGCFANQVKSFIPLHFDTNSVALQPRHKTLIDALVSDLRLNPDAKINIRGFSDPIGSDEAKMTISLQRALSVANQIEDMGLKPQILSVKGMGHVDEKHDLPYAQQRVVEIEVLGCNK
ncbi:hypothetical protein THIAE_06075 [Thiomicrospira aerophila AL3]|uniref:OmpA-like domain-containing protein n=1 Tax=Thiomicrospira aerophila AL3 TaxID=717772 RepID=W0DWM2_9GAMM|nr:OmpA family protein [Thiomicrospira aerophila]AHF01394.1 hypothetical protein THIAE_06075 [Thiomicrospira aerophila AL3]